MEYEQKRALYVEARLKEETAQAALLEKQKQAALLGTTNSPALRSSAGGVGSPALHAVPPPLTLNMSGVEQDEDEILAQVLAASAAAAAAPMMSSAVASAAAALPWACPDCTFENIPSA